MITTFHFRLDLNANEYHLRPSQRTNDFPKVIKYTSPSLYTDFDAFLINHPFWRDKSVGGNTELQFNEYSTESFWFSPPSLHAAWHFFLVGLKHRIVCTGIMSCQSWEEICLLKWESFPNLYRHKLIHNPASKLNRPCPYTYLFT